MFVHAGMTMYGKVDQVPGLLHVGTQFFHVNFIPLIPLGSYVVIEGVEVKEDQPPGVPISFNFRSLFFAWLRAGLIAGGVFAAMAAIIEGFRLLHRHGQPGFAAAMAVLALVLFAVLPLTYRLTRATPFRALALARHADIEPEAVAPFFVHHPALVEDLDRQGI
jgi:hypothetical protein